MTSPSTVTASAPSVARRSDRLVRHLARQGAHQLNHLRVGGLSRLAGAVPFHRQTGVVATLPVNDHLKSIAD
jgi:hypothetical protein